MIRWLIEDYKAAPALGKAMNWVILAALAALILIPLVIWMG